MNDRDEGEVDLIGYLLGALDPDEAARVAARIDRDPLLRDEADRLYASLPKTEATWGSELPPPGLAERTMAALEQFADSPAAAALSAAGAPAPVGPLAVEPVPTSTVSSNTVSASDGGTSGFGSRSWGLQDWIAVTAMTALLASLAVPALINSRHQAQLTACRNNLRTVGRAIGDYADIHRGRMPVGEPGSPFETVGAYAPILAAESLIRDDDLICPSSSFKNEVGTFRIPTAEQLIRMKPDALAYMQRVMGGSYGFTLGYAIDGAVQELKREGNPFRVVMADRPEGGDLAVAHGNGMNVLFDDGHCAFLHLDSPSLLDPQLFVNRIGAVAPGLDQDDSVIAPSHVRRVWPVRLQD